MTSDSGVVRATLFPSRSRLALLAALAAFGPAVAGASDTTSVKVAADTYVSSGEPTVNFGTKGGMEIGAPTAAQNRTEESLTRYNTASIKSYFDSEYGAGDWTVTSVSLKCFSNYASAGTQPGNSSFNIIAAGNFEFDLVGDNSWSETGITWNTFTSWISTTSTSSLGTFYWAADGSSSQTWSLNLSSDLVSDILSGGLVSLLGAPSANSTVGYLFNTTNNNPSYLYVTADALTVVPEPGCGLVALAGLGTLALWNRWRNRC